MRISKSWRALLLAVAACAVLSSFSLAQADRPGAPQEVPCLLVLHSYHHGFAWSDNLSRGIHVALAEYGKPIEHRVEYLDARHLYSEEYFQSFLDLLKLKYTGQNIDVIICCDDHALNFMLGKGQAVFPNVPIVFCSVTGYTPSMREDRQLTGLQESIDIEATLNLALKLHPNTKEVAVILDTSRTGKALRAKAEKVFLKYAPQLSFRYLEDLSMGDLQTEVARLSKKTIVFLFIFKPSESGAVLSHEQNLELLAPHCTVPIYAVWEFYLGHGIVGGKLTNGRAEGKMACDMALRILNGEKASDIPLGISPTQCMFDFKQLQRFHIPVSRLPKDSVIVGRPFSFYETYKLLIWAVVLIVLLLLSAVAVLWHDAQQRKRMESVIRESESRFRNVVESSAMGIHMYELQRDDKLIFKAANRTADTILGVKNSQFVGKTIEQAFPSLSHTEIPNRYREVASTGKPWSTEQITYKDDLVTGCYEVHAFQTGPRQMAAMFMDVTERKTAQEEMARLYQAVNQAAESIIITDFRGKILYVNPCFENMTGYLRAEVVGKDPSILGSGKQDKAFYDDLWETIASGRIWRGHFINKKKDGTFFEEEAVISPVHDVHGKIVNYVCVKRDVTQQRALEGQVRQSQKMAAIGQLAHRITHTFTNSLMRILGHAQLALTKTTEIPDVTQHLNEIMTAGNEVSTVAAELLAFAHPAPLRRKKIGLDKVVVGVREIIQKSLVPEIEVIYKIHDDTGKVDVDPTQIEQAIVHMAINSAEAMPNGGTLTIETCVAPLTEREKIALQAGLPDEQQHKGDFILLSLKDTGCGMTDEVKAHIFEPFYTSKKDHKNAGLGLSTVYRIVDMHDGYILVESHVGGGTAFKIFLPGVE